MAAKKSLLSAAVRIVCFHYYNFVKSKIILWTRRGVDGNGTHHAKEGPWAAHSRRPNSARLRAMEYARRRGKPYEKRRKKGSNPKAQGLNEWLYSAPSVR